MSYYECKRCNHRTKQKTEMTRHLNRKIKCVRSIDSYKYTDNEINDISLIKLNSKTDSQTNSKSDSQTDAQTDVQTDAQTNAQTDSETDAQTNSKTNSKTDSKTDSQTNSKTDSQTNSKTDLQTNSKTDSHHNSKTNSKIFICNNCNNSFTRKFNLDRHKEKCINNSTVTNIVNNTCNNTLNTLNNITNNNNILINLKLESFDNEWDVSKINKFTRHSLLLSRIMYTNLLKTILDNESNLNVIIEKDTNEGIVYKNDIEKFIKMNLKDIIDDSMYKLNKHLKDFYNESINDEEFILMDKIFKEQKDIIETKYKDYKDNKETQQIVEKYITDIYDKKKEEALKLYNQVLIQNNEINLIDGF